MPRGVRLPFPVFDTNARKTVAGLVFFFHMRQKKKTILHARENLAQAMGDDLGVAFFGYVAQSFDEEKAGCAIRPGVENPSCVKYA